MLVLFYHLFFCCANKNSIVQHKVTQIHSLLYELYGFLPCLQIYDLYDYFELIVKGDMKFLLNLIFVHMDISVMSVLFLF